MKKLFILALVLGVSCAFAEGVPSPATPRLQIDSDGTLVSPTNPLPTTATIASATFTPAGALDVTPQIVDDSGNIVDMPGTASGVYTIPRPYDTASTTIGSFTITAYTMPLKSGCQTISVTLTQADKEAWFAVNADPTVGNGYPFHTNVEVSNLNPGDVLKFIASETIGACWIQR